LKYSAPPGGWVVKLSSSNPSFIGVPASVNIPAGHTTATFTITTKAYAYNTYTAYVTAKDATTSASGLVTVTR
jgi:hypothetical protein